MSVAQNISLSVTVFNILENQHWNSNNTATQQHIHMVKYKSIRLKNDFLHNSITNSVLNCDSLEKYDEQHQNSNDPAMQHCIRRVIV